MKTNHKEESGIEWFIFALLVGGAIGFIGCLIWLIVRIVNGNSKRPPVIGLLLSLVMLVGGVVSVPESGEPAAGGPDSTTSEQVSKDAASGNPAPEDTPDSEEASGDGQESGQGGWYVGYYMDEFKEPTDQWYITAPAFSGTYNEPGTMEGELSVEVLVDCWNEVAFLLYEGNNLKTTLYSFQDDMYYIIMRTADGSDYPMSGTMYSSNSRYLSNSHLCIDEEYVGTVLQAMLTGETISFYIENIEHPTVNYLFSIETDGFSDVYHSPKPEADPAGTT